MTPLTIAIVYASVAVAVFVCLGTTRDSHNKAGLFECAVFAIFWPWCVMVLLFCMAMARR